MNKRGVSSAVLGIIVGLIFVLIAIAIYFPLTKEIKTGTEGDVVNLVCKTSLDLTAQRIKGPLGITLLETGAQPKCKTYDILITQKDVDLIKSSTKENDENSIKRIIAEIMTKGIRVTTLNDKGTKKRTDVGGMWATVSRGTKQLFEDEAGVFCLPWATIGFDDEVKKKVPNINRFNSYLLETPIEKGKPQTYFEYLSNSEGLTIQDKSQLNNIQSQSALSTSNEYSLFFIQDVQTNWEAWGTVIGVTAGALILAPFTFGGSIAAAAVIIGTAAVGGGLVGYGAGGLVMGDGYTTSYHLIQYDKKSVKELGCNILK